MNEVTLHHTLFGLNEHIRILKDDRDPNSGNASHVYEVSLHGEHLFTVSFQHGPRLAAGSTPGVTNEALLAIVMDRLEGFQDGPFACDENAKALFSLKEALSWLQWREQKRHEQKVLGKNESHE